MKFRSEHGQWMSEPPCVGSVTAIHFNGEVFIREDESKAEILKLRQDLKQLEANALKITTRATLEFVAKQTR